jgi:hypothetical protein
MASSFGFLNSLASILTRGGGVHDYAHAAQVFRTSGFSRSPKYKFLYYVNFVISTDVASNVNASEIGVLVKSIDLPKFTVDVKDLNQYNRHTYIQDRIKYEPVTIKFHDDNNNALRQLWADYYNYYYADGKYDLNTYNNDDRYQTGSNHVSAWGLDNGSDVPFLSAIEIYSMYGGQSNKITLMTPVITSFSHDTHEYSDGQGVMEATMQVRYNGVTYEDGFVSGIPGFSDSAYYDNTPSSLSGSLVNGNYYIDPLTGQLQQQTDGFSNRNAVGEQYGYYDTQQQGYQYDPSSNQNLSSAEIDAIINNDSNGSNADTVFPVADTNTQTIATSVPLPPVNPNVLDSTANPDSTSNSNITLSPYTTGSWQQTLWNQGYSAEQINSASDFIATVPTSTVAGYGGFSNTVSSQALIAQQYIDNPSSVNNIGTVNFGQPTNVPSSLTFSDATTPPSAQYNSNTWQAELAAQGYSQSDINAAATHLSQINLAPGTNLTSLAQNYILYNKTNTAA